jgi:cysteinyl-tRNA synthetase
MNSLTLPNGQPLIDLHSGGEDNIFPHHECEIAQSCCAFNAAPDQGSFAKMWFHPRFLLVEGTKMSKSKGNFYTARDLFAKGIEAAAVRLELIKTHYRSNANFTMQGLQDSQRRIDRWRRGAEDLTRRQGQPVYSFMRARFAEQVREKAARIAADLNDDLNVPNLVAHLDELYGEASEQLTEAIRTAEEKVVGRTSPTPPPVALPTEPLELAAANEMLERGISHLTFDAELALLHLADRVLGVIFAPRLEQTKSDIGVFIGINPDPAVTAKLEVRRAARAAKDFKKSDQIRDQLAAMGFQIKDVAGGKVEVRRM